MALLIYAECDICGKKMFLDHTVTNFSGARYELNDLAWAVSQHGHGRQHIYMVRCPDCRSKHTCGPHPSAGFESGKKSI